MTTRFAGGAAGRDGPGSDLAGARIRINGPAELVQAVPYMLGFHPRRSLVLVGLRDDGGHRVTARHDLADLTMGPYAGLTPDGAAMIATVAERMAGAEVQSVVAVVYHDEAAAGGRASPACSRVSRGDDGRLPYDMVALALPDLVTGTTAIGLSERVVLLDTLLVADGRWWSYDCVATQCCPDEGSPLPEAPSDYATDAVVRGVVPLADRESFARLLEPLADRERLAAHLAAAEEAAMTAGVDGDGRRYRRAVVRALFAAARASAEPSWLPPDDPTVARFVAALGSLAVRDAVWMGVESGRIDGRPLWRHLARHAPEPYDAMPLFLYGWASWRDGDGASASIAAERAVVSDPGCSAADLLLAALSQGVDPRTFPRLRKPS